MLLVASPELAAQPTCDPANNIFYVAVMDDIPVTGICPAFIGDFCKLPVDVGAERYRVLNGCDPTTTSCTVEVLIAYDFPGNNQNGNDNGLEIHWFDTSSPDSNCDPGDSPGGADCPNRIATCGTWFARIIIEDEVETFIRLSNVSCETIGAEPTLFSTRAWTCWREGVGCHRWTDINDIAVDGPELAEGIGCVAPVEPPKDDSQDSCQVQPAGGAGANVKGTGPSLAENGSGPGAKFGYRAGGVGNPSFPGTTEWLPVLGRNWSHTYAQRIVEDPDENHVWLLTEFGSFREFSDLSGGVYTTNSPSDEYRTLTWLGEGLGWELEDLVGTVISFDANGNWTQTVDRNGNATAATYNGTELEEVSFPDGRSEVFVYDMNGRLDTIIEIGVTGSMLEWDYDWTGDDLTRVDRPDGTALIYLYDDAAWPGYLTRKELAPADASPNRVLQAWEYDVDGNVAKTWKGDVDSMGPEAIDPWELVYNAGSTDVIDPLGTTSTYTYELTPSGKARVNSITGACPTCGFGPNTSFEYSDLVHLLLPTAAIDERDTRTEFAYDANGRMVSRTEAVADPLEREATWEYSNASFPGIATAMEVPSTAGAPDVRRTESMLDGSGNAFERRILGIEQPLGAFDYLTETLFNGAGLPLSIDPPGYGTTDTTSFTYDAARGDLVILTRTDPLLVGTITFGHDDFNRQTSVIDSNGVETVTAYDELDRVTSVTRKGDVPQDDLVTTHEYNVYKDLERTTLPEGNVIEYGYDAAGRLTSIARKPDTATPAERTQYTLDATGNRIKEELQRWTGAVFETRSETDSVYSTRCQLDKTIRAPGTPEESVTEYAYDCNGNLEKIWDANHPSAGKTNPATSVNTYDVLNRIETVTQPWAGAGGGDALTSYGYDVQDHLVQVEDAEGNVTTYEYSDRDLLTEQISPVSGTESFEYNEHGALTNSTDALGTLVTRTIDALDRVTFADYPAGTLDTTWTYHDPLVPFSRGRLTLIERPNSTVSFEYDRFGRLTRDGGLDYLYDKNGNQTRVAYPKNVTTSFEYDFADRPETLELRVGSDPVQTIVSASTYEPLGPLASLDLGNGVIETRTFDGRYTPDGIVAGALLDWQYDTDGVGNIRSITDQLDPGQNRTYDYQDIHYFLTQGDGPWGDRSWSYDRIGNRLTEVRDTTTDTYTYLLNGGSGNLPTLDEVALGGGGTRKYNFDAAGNMRGHRLGADRLSLTYDKANRVRRFDPEATLPRTSLRYDGRGFLVLSRFEPDGGDIETTVPTYSSDGLYHHSSFKVTSASPPPVRHRYVLYFGGRPVALLEGDENGGNIDNTVLRYVTTDHLGTPLLATDELGAQTWSGGFEAFGADWNSAQAAGVFLRFPGQWEDETWENGSLSTGLSYNVHRWYEKGTGRYGRADPLGPQGDPNLYVYVGANPLRFIDQLGLLCQLSPSWKTCLQRVFGEDLSDVKIFDNARLVTTITGGLYASGRDAIFLPGGCDRFFADPYLVLHEFYHVVDQWNTGRMTLPRYLFESGRQTLGGRDPHLDNQFEREADYFANTHEANLQECLSCAQQPSGPQQ